eukprot:352616-Chlamydomonas_euryale.AAC.15
MNSRPLRALSAACPLTPPISQASGSGPPSPPLRRSSSEIRELEALVAAQQCQLSEQNRRLAQVTGDLEQVWIERDALVWGRALRQCQLSEQIRQLAQVTGNRRPGAGVDWGDAFWCGVGHGVVWGRTGGWLAGGCVDGTCGCSSTA